MAQAAMAAELHAIVLYGRTIRPWMLFAALALGDVLASIPNRTRSWAVGAVLLAAAWSFTGWAPEYRALAYPSDVLYALGIDTSRVPPDRVWCEFAPGTPYASPGPLNRTTRSPYHESSDVVLINFCQDFSAGRRTLPADPSDRVLLYEGRHWLTFPAYTYEGFIPEARRALIDHPLRVRAYGGGLKNEELRTKN
jgi:hypothetical protein